ncbi:ubinuclein-1 isoform X1 [Poecilia formosa]|uniref:Ubinuclein-1-like n=1 Tax=Poecilia formosa TaxID=48698 RepID=A0A096LSV7_POEFO|nr:PREDICTED: ubinuclein-1-like isoform X1 [Poecilia formosa]XP_016525798.1 PREDICTED: ubinuclein-1-like isoform X1 [Poecilia formosa]
MAESRRVPLTTLSCGVGSFGSEARGSAQQGSPVVPQDTRTSSAPPSGTETVRLVLTLFEPDKRSFPEFNYCELIENELQQTDDVPLSRLEERQEHEEAAAVARKSEEKSGGKHKKKDRIEDLVDIGYGYDDEDSFIDNSEAYDEFVPSTLTTKFGGFYVNSGVLHFRQATDIDDSTDEGIFQPTKKRKLDIEQNPKKRGKALGAMKTNTNLSTKSKLGVDEGKLKKKKKAKTLSVTSMLKKFQREKERERKKRGKAHQTTTTTAAAAVTEPATPASTFPPDGAGGGGSTLTDPLLSLIGSTNDHALIQAASTVDFDIDLDSLLEASEESLSPKSLPQTAAEAQLNIRSDDQIQQNAQTEGESQLLTTKTSLLLTHQSEQLQLQAEPGPVVLTQSAPLPEGLPPELEDSIRNLVTAAKTSEGESKLKFFSPDINSILLNIELQCQEQSSQLRSKVYKHLSSFMPCSKDTLMKRVKKLLITHEEETPGAEDQLQQLKEAIDRSMPEQVACFQESCQAYEKAKTSKETEEDRVAEKSARKAVPKKLFKWNQEIRDCLGLLLKEKMATCQKEGKEGQELEEYMKTVLDNEVKPLWPKGWMQSRVLMRESRKLSGLFASLLVNKAKSCQTEKRPDRCRSNQGTEELKVESGVSVSFSPPKADGLPETPGCSLLDILADQALACEQPLALSRDYLATAVFKPWNVGTDNRSPPLPPPPPHSSPINFPESQVVLPHLLQVGDIKSFGVSQLRNGQ